VQTVLGGELEVGESGIVDEVGVDEKGELGVWGAQTRFHAERLYSWTGPPRRSGRSTTDAVDGRTTRSFGVGCGGARFNEPCGLWLS
jgi:hypothetical protein